MEKDTYLSLLIFCALWSQGLAVTSNENFGNSSDLHIRKKRVINHSQGGIQPAHITMARHIVQILVADNFECAGSILQANIILTAKNCLYGTDDQYTVLSGSLTKLSGNRHRVPISLKHPGTNLALMRINPPIHLSPRGNARINLYSGVLLPGSSGLFSGWGCTNITPEGERTYPPHLMAALLPIITHEQCLQHILASHEHLPGPDVICTLDARRERGACYGDEGGSLVYGGRLLGIYSHNHGVNLGVHPDIYVNLNHEDLAHWINVNSRDLQRMRFPH